MGWTALVFHYLMHIHTCFQRQKFDWFLMIFLLHFLKKSIDFWQNHDWFFFDWFLKKSIQIYWFFCKKQIRLKKSISIDFFQSWSLWASLVGSLTSKYFQHNNRFNFMQTCFRTTSFGLCLAIYYNILSWQRTFTTVSIVAGVTLHRRFL